MPYRPVKARTIANLENIERILFMKEKIRMTMDRETAQIISRACEFYSRVLCGQYGEITEEIFTSRLCKVHDEEGEEKMHEVFSDLMLERHEATTYIEKARATQFPELHPLGHYGFGYTKNTDRAFDVYQVLRHLFAWHDHPEGGWTVNFDKPFTKYDLPEAEFIKEE